MLATGGSHAREPPWAERVALELFIEYAAARYGPERLPVLLRALDNHDTWDGLIPAVYGVSAGDFEQGWLDYIDAQVQALTH